MGAVGDRHRLQRPRRQEAESDRPILAGIYFGKITNWNDPKIKKINPKAKLPNLAITPVFRSDGSGTTYAFTNYLSKVSTAWKNEVGYATSVGFKAGVGAKGNAGVTSTVTSTNGAIGYISASYLDRSRPGCRSHRKQGR